MRRCYPPGRVFTEASTESLHPNGLCLRSAGHGGWIEGQWEQQKDVEKLGVGWVWVWDVTGL